MSSITKSDRRREKLMVKIVGLMGRNGIRLDIKTMRSMHSMAVSKLGGVYNKMLQETRSEK